MGDTDKMEIIRGHDPEDDEDDEDNEDDEDDGKGLGVSDAVKEVLDNLSPELVEAVAAAVEEKAAHPKKPKKKEEEEDED